MKRHLTILALITIGTTLFCCKKKEERYLIRHYEGTYSVKHIKTWCCDSLMHTASETEEIELEVKKSMKGVKIKGVAFFNNFEVNDEDSTLNAETKDRKEWASGQFHPNDSISLRVSLSNKLPFAHYYRMNKK